MEMEQEIKYLHKKVVQLEDMIVNMNETFGKVLDGLLNYRTKQVQEEQDLCRTLFSHLKSNVVPISTTKSDTANKSIIIRPNTTGNTATIRQNSNNYNNKSCRVPASDNSTDELNIYSPSTSSTSSVHRQHFVTRRKQSTDELVTPDEDESSNEVEFVHPPGRIKLQRRFGDRDQQPSSSCSSTSRSQQQAASGFDTNFVLVPNSTDYTANINSAINNNAGLHQLGSESSWQDEYFNETEDDDDITIKSEGDEMMGDEDFSEDPISIIPDLNQPQQQRRRFLQQDVSNYESNNAVRIGAGGRRVRTVFHDYQIQLMETHFRKEPAPNPTTMRELSIKTRLDLSVVKIWFQNRRAKARRN